MTNKQEPAGMINVLGQFLMLPVTVFVYGVEMLIKTMQGIHHISHGGMEVMSGPQAQPNGLPGVRAAPGPEQEAPLSGPIAASPGDSTETNFKEENPLSTNGDRANGQDKDLHDDMLKLVRYKVLFVRREYEHAFSEQEDLVSDNMDGAAFTAWKIAEFIQDLHRGTTPVPAKWADKKYPPQEFVKDKFLNGLPHEDKKYLRIYYEVLERYPREKFKYEEQQIRVLEDIRDTLASREEADAGPAPTKKK
jgi:hypothetical protein